MQQKYWILRKTEDWKRKIRQPRIFQNEKMQNSPPSDAVIVISSENENFNSKIEHRRTRSRGSDEEYA